MAWMCDYGGPDWYSGAWPRAKKEHRCVECGEIIQKGEKYGAFSGKWDGDVSTHRQHILCEDACRYVRDNIEGDCLCFGELFDYISDTGILEKRHLLRLTDETRKKETREFRQIVARIKWRKERGTDFPAFLPPLNLYETSLKKLADDRLRGRI